MNKLLRASVFMGTMIASGIGLHGCLQQGNQHNPNTRPHGMPFNPPKPEGSNGLPAAVLVGAGITLGRAKSILNILRANDNAILSYDIKPGRSTVSIDDFYFSGRPHERPVESLRRKIAHYDRQLQALSAPLADAQNSFGKLKEKMAGFMVESDSLQGREINTGNWLGNPEEVLEKAGYQTRGNLFTLKLLLNAANLLTEKLSKRNILYAGMGADTSYNCRYNLIEPLLASNFDLLVGVEFDGMEYSRFIEATTRELNAVKDPVSGRYLSETARFGFISDNVYEATFWYLGKERSVKAYFKTDINSRNYPVGDVNIIFDESHGMRKDTFDRLIGGMKEKGFLLGYGDDYYECPSRSCGVMTSEYFGQHFVEINSSPFYELSLSELRLIGGVGRFLIYQRK